VRRAGITSKPIDGAELLSEIITQIKILKTPIVRIITFFHLQYRAGTTPAAGAKAVLNYSRNSSS
jgi:hypothetical protein